MNQKMRDRFFKWFWRGKKSSIGDRLYYSFAGAQWTRFCEAMTAAYAAGYRAGKRDKP